MKYGSLLQGDLYTVGGGEIFERRKGGDKHVLKIEEGGDHIYGDMACPDVEPRDAVELISHHRPIAA